jgi:enoyl-CoA hydratase/carnithine racemase
MLRQYRTLVTYSADRVSKIATLSLNKPSTKNAFDKQQLDLLSDAIHQAAADNPRVLILKSDLPGVFCAGADLKERSTLNNHQVHLFVSRLRAVFQDLAVRVFHLISAQLTLFASYFNYLGYINISLYPESSLSNDFGH